MTAHSGKRNSIPMNYTDLKSPDTPTDQLPKIRHALVDGIWKGLVIVALLGAPASVSRYTLSGWRPVYSFHIGAALLALAVYWFRARISFKVKSALLILIFWSIGLVGVFTFGLLGTGYWWLMLSSLFVSIFYSLRAGIASALAVILLVAAAGAGFINGALKFPMDADLYIVSGPAWANLIFATIVTAFVIFQAIAVYQRTTVHLLDDLHKQRDLIQQLATHDQLTGLPLLSLADDRLQMALHAAHRSGKKVALLFIDLDDFKSVNDTLGHEAGDYVLKEISCRLSAVIRIEDTVARVGGDEFIVILGDLLDNQEVVLIAGRAIGAISVPIDYEGRRISVGASIGISLFPDHANDAQTLRRAADAAMYTAKRSGKNRYALAERTYGVGSTE